MQKISKLFVRANPISVRAFSIQNDMHSFDFTDKLNVEELKLKNPQNT